MWPPYWGRTEGPPRQFNGEVFARALERIASELAGVVRFEFFRLAGDGAVHRQAVASFDAVLGRHA